MNLHQTDSAPAPYYEDGDVVIYHGDCRDILPLLEPVDAVITDPPYGVGFTGKKTKHVNRRGGESYEDTEENFRQVVLPAVEQALAQTRRAAIFTGTRRLQEYPRARDVGGIMCPNGGGMAAWGFSCLHPVLLYGMSPYQESGKGARPTGTVMYHPGMHVTGENNGHPCPKPIAFMSWLVNLASLPGETVLDPFMGSGTTLRAAKDLGRRAIGIEIEERYCEIAVARLGQQVLDLGEAA